jgi:uncharacterized membrane protein YuzA (DUF378 family)
MLEIWKNLNCRKFTDSLGFPLALAAFAHSASGIYANLEWGLVGVTGLMAFVMLFEKASSSARWKSFVEWVEEYDFGYVVFGMGLMAGANAITSNIWGIILFLFAGAGFMVVGIGRMNSRQMVEVATRSPKVAVWVGIVLGIAAAVWAVVRRGEITSDPLHGTDALIAYFLFGMGAAYVFAGLLTSRRRRRQALK